MIKVSKYMNKRIHHNLEIACEGGGQITIMRTLDKQVLFVDEIFCNIGNTLRGKAL